MRIIQRNLWITSFQLFKKKLWKLYFLELEQKFRDIAFQQEIQIIGSYDPNIVGCTSDEFYDAMHPKESCMQKVVSKFKSALTH